MSKFVKNLITEEIRNRLQGVGDLLLVDVMGLDANKTFVLRKRLREKNIHLLVVKNTLARRATEGTPLAAAFEGLEGSSAIVWGAEDIVSLAKEVAALDEANEFEQFKARGGVMDGEPLTAERVKQVSKWPSREEQLSILVGQILSPGANLAGALLGPGAALASQIKSKAEEEEAAAAEAPAAAE